jgi:hypothetical protein
MNVTSTEREPDFGSKTLVKEYITSDTACRMDLFSSEMYKNKHITK